MVGFGDTERAFEAAVEEEITELAQRLYDEHVAGGGDFMFLPDGYADRLGNEISELGEASRKQAEEYKADPPPSGRYGYWYSHLTRSASTVVVVLKFHHINRRHPFSPDGWGLYQSKRFVEVEHWELDRKRREEEKAAKLAAV